VNIGILKENALSERRVALSPAGVQSIVTGGHVVYVERNAGSQSLFTDEEYNTAGGHITYSVEETINRADTVLKVSPPNDLELTLLHEGQAYLSFLQLAVSQRRTIESLLERKVNAVAFELIENQHGDLTVLQVMSEIAGQISIQAAAHYLQAKEGGRGILLGSLPGVPPASVVILGAGTVGRTAARVALGMGATVIVLDKDLSRLRELENLFQWRITTAIANEYNIEKAVRYADVVIGAVLLKGEKAPHLVTEKMVKQMKVGSIIVDASIDLGGCVETSRPTTLEDPVFISHGVVHYCVPNIPATVARTATMGLTNALLPYLHEITDLGIEQALRNDPGFSKGICTYNGYCTNKAIAKIFNLKARDINLLLAPFEPSKN
jgi:alanine dehydrogenase